MYVGISAVQNERQPRNSAQVRQDQLEAELHHGGSSSEHGSLGCAVGPGVMSGATVSATHPAFTPVRPAHEAPAAAATTPQHRCTTTASNNDTDRRAGPTGRKTDSEHAAERQITGISMTDQNSNGNNNTGSNFTLDVRP